MDNPAWLWPFIGGALSFAAGAYFHGYLTKKGENLATHEDIAKLNDQMRVLTTTTETIKGEISDALWNRQKRWELKRDVLLEAAKKLSQLNQAMVSLDSAVPIKSDDEQWAKFVAEERDTFMRMWPEFDNAVALVAVVCSSETYHALHKFFIQVNGAATDLFGGDSEIPPKRRRELVDGFIAAQTALRKELGIEDTPQKERLPGGA
jgi:hypothetical protein